MVRGGDKYLVAKIDSFVFECTQVRYFFPDGLVKRDETIYNIVAMKNNKLQKRMDQIAQVLGELYPNPSCALNFSCPLELLIATILSAQCTDKRVNEVSQTLFKKYRTAEDYANVSQEEFEEFLKFVDESKVYDTGELIEYGDRMIMLSTCEYSVDNGRLVVIARKQQ